MAGTAHAEESLALPLVAEEEARIVLAIEADDTGDEQSEKDAGQETIEPISVAVDTAAWAIPADLLLANARLDANSAPLGPVRAGIAAQTVPATTVAIDSAASGVVTPQGIDTFYGHINPFYGNINPFYGDIDAFWGNINPFYGDIDAFWGHINPFYGHINPFYGDIDAFWGDIDAFYGDIGAFDAAHLNSLGNFWTAAGAQIKTTETSWSSLKFTTSSSGAVTVTFDGTPNKVRTSLETLIAQADAQFGAAYTAKTGKNFRTGLVAEILARHGLDLGDSGTAKTTLAKTDAQRAAFYLDWHDSLMQYAGIDQIDHWMAATNWTPAVTQIQGEGADSVIGIIDGSFSTDTDLANNIVWAGGSSNSLNGHGAGVASLIAGAHDGVGVMGIAPRVHIATYNPFGTDGTSSWDAVANGIQQLQYAYVRGVNETGYVSIINLSLGEKGWTLSQGLADVLARPGIAQWHDENVFVVAAGNDGITQTTNINWDFSRDAPLILVGSINPLGEISNFSNRPGNACLLDNGVCHAGNEIFNRFVVAPGELLLVSDGHNGVVRRSGTSFAAPLVSGAISLLHDRWPWLVRHSYETTEIIFRSARDLGAPGVDPVYGHGLLDVTASQSPLDFNAMTFRSYQKIGLSWVQRDVSTLDLLAGGIPAWWNTSELFFTMFENIGDTYRDFSVPVSALTFGTSTNVLGRGSERLQDFVSARFARWINSNGADSNGDGAPGFSEVRSNGSQLPGDWSLRYDAIMPSLSQDGAWTPTHGAATLTNPNGSMSFTIGHGQGSMALSGYRFGVISDHDPFTGGVNPVLGLASGDVFAAAAYQIAPGTTVRVGYSENRERWDDIANVDPQTLMVRQQLGDRPASAVTLDLEQQVTDRISLGAQYTRLREVNAILGTQTAVNALLGNGSHTEAMSVSATIDAGNGLSFDLSATGARTETAGGQLLSNSGKIWSTAGQFTATKRGVLAGNDTLRLSVAQPLQIEQGELQLRSDQVVDRVTGETAPVTQTFGIQTRKRITGEAVYALPLSNRSEFGAFARYVSAGELGDEESVVAGATFSVRF
ncbi:S8 family serine peptidase [Erythrobacter sp. JK5]|uniref:S8 family peptidase n=1 Tax=Erythrobacter sp. JK5 TaxID=2829500 RepID=UPI001BACE36B|nr:S8 family serine peptidase [Erythrobacter sp. JK5]QUL38979.1 S8 family serine peptidase [Erythrobacter sp. JK5]